MLSRPYPNIIAHRKVLSQVFERKNSGNFCVKWNMKLFYGQIFNIGHLWAATGWQSEHTFARTEHIRNIREENTNKQSPSYSGKKVLSSKAFYPDRMQSKLWGIFDLVTSFLWVLVVNTSEVTYFLISTSHWRQGKARVIPPCEQASYICITHIVWFIILICLSLQGFCFL